MSLLVMSRLWCRRLGRVLACLSSIGAMTFCGAAEVRGQTEEPPLNTGTVRFGPVTAHPKILVGAGIESNVFYEPVNPKRDTTLTVIPGADVRMRMGRGSISWTTQAMMTYYRTYEDQQSTNPSHDVRFDVPLNRMIIRGSFNWLSTRQRPTLEIDLRARHLQYAYTATVDLRVVSKTAIRVGGFTSRTAFESDAVFDQTNLREALNRRGVGALIGVRHALTPLTTLTLTSEWLEDRFEFSSFRDARGFRFMPGVEFGRSALIRGSAAVGYGRFVPDLATVPSYSGLVAAINLSTVIRGSTRIAVSAGREVTYSYDINTPYYLQPSATASVTQRITPRWEIVASASWQRLTYALASNTPVRIGVAPGELPALRPTIGTVYGFGVGYVFPTGLRLGFAANHDRRHAGAVGSDYQSWVIGSSVSYGF